MQLTLIAGITVVTVALPAVQQDLGITTADLALVNIAYGLSFGGLLMLGGRLADLLGRRWAFRLGAAIFAAGSFAALVAPGFAALVAARFVQGVGAALAAPAALALLGAVYHDPRQRARVTALWGGVNGVGATAGTLLSGVVVTFVSWRWVFAIPAAVALCVALFAGRVLPSPPPQSTTLDVASAALVTVGVTALSLGFLRAEGSSWATPEVSGSIAVGAVVLAGFFVRQARMRAPMLPRAFLAASDRRGDDLRHGRGDGDDGVPALAVLPA